MTHNKTHVDEFSNLSYVIISFQKPCHNPKIWVSLFPHHPQPQHLLQPTATAPTAKLARSLNRSPLINPSDLSEPTQWTPTTCLDWIVNLPNNIKAATTMLFSVVAMKKICWGSCELIGAEKVSFSHQNLEKRGLLSSL